MIAATPALLWPIDACLALLSGWLLIAVLGLIRPAHAGLGCRVLYPAGAAIGGALALVAGWSLSQPATQRVLLIGLPDLPMHLRLDALSALFLVLLGAASMGISLFAAGYFRRPQGAPPGLIVLQYHLFLASMALVLLADDAYSFMLAWETMALSSYFLVTSDHRVIAIRQAGFLYLLIAHVGALAILMCFGLLQGGSWQFTFDAMRGARLTGGWSALAFALALLGFGAKAGLVPLHVWLPEAHPAAPSPVSALMSGVMLKTALYGLLRVSFDLLVTSQWWWGLLPLAMGLFTALYGIAFAAVQSDMKRLLAYSSIENTGILFAGVGLALVFEGVGMRAVAALALLAVLYHALNHACMKSLLFLGTGAVLHATGERNMGRLGGLIHRMPWVAWTALIGALALAGLPPLNGFVSEWLLLQAFLLTPEVPRTFVNMLLPLGAAVLVLVAALAAYVMVKYFGIVYLGQPRGAARAPVHDAQPLERAGLCWLAAGCVLLGLLPGQIVPWLHAVTLALHLEASAPAAPWWSVMPLASRQASYAPLVLLLAVLGLVGLSVAAVRLLYRGRVRRVPAWNCGSGVADARMQDTAEGFGQPIRRIFQPFFAIERELPSAFDSAPHYHVRVSDRFWSALYLPLGVLVRRSADSIAWLQRGRIAVYLLYSFVTLLLLLAFVL